jgi:Oxidoreductase family, NAD-binding Rossmann fold/WD domain, G-beta repeat
MNRVVLGVFAAQLWLISLTGLAADVTKYLDALGAGKTPAKGHQLKELTRWSALPSWATSVAFSADDRTLAIGLKDKIQLADLATKSIGKTIELKSGQVRSLAYSADGKYLAAGAYQRVTLLDSTSGEVLKDLKGHRGYVTGVAFSPDSKRLATSCEDEAVRIWTLQNDPTALVLKGHGYPVTGIAWSSDGKLIGTSAGDELRPTKPGQVKVWDATTGSIKHQFELHSKAATGVSFSADSHFLLSSSVDERVNVYDLAKDKPLGFFAGHSRPTNAVLVHPDGETAISVSGGRAVGKNELMVWEFETGEPLAAIEAHEARITSLAVSHDGRQVATASQDQSVALWNVAFLAVGLTELTAAKTESPPADASAAVATALDQNANTAVQNASVETKQKILRVGIIGLDTSHAPAFAKTMNANPPIPGAEGCRIVAAYPKGSPDIKSSVDRVPGYIEAMKKLNVEIVDSIDELLKQVDAVLIETNDGRPHYEQLIPCLKAGKPCFIDKPIAGSLADAIAIFEASKKYRVPVFSSSSLRFGKNSLAVRGGSLGKVICSETTSPASLEATHPDLFWYGIHGVESLFTVMGTGCQSVIRGKTAEGKIEVVGHWAGGRTGTYREGGGYVGKAVGEKGESPVGSYDGYDPLVFAIVKFFHTGVAPVTPEETLEIYAFMEAADESKRQNGASVTLESVMDKAKAEAAKKLEK